MSKLLEKTGKELFASLVNIAIPINNLVQDEKLINTLTNCASVKEIPEYIRKNNLAYVMKLYSELIPLLFSDEHLKDVVSILAEIEGVSSEQMLSMNGADLLNDAITAWREQIGPFVKRSGITGLTTLFFR